MFSFHIEDDLKLVLPTERDAAEMCAVARANLEELKLWMPWATADYSEESARQFIRGNLSEFATTGSFGNYRFDSVPVGAVYTISVLSKKYSFAQPTRVLSVTDELTDVDFTAIE